MGQIFSGGGLTNPGVADPTGGKTQFFPNPAAAGMQMASEARQTAQPSSAALDNSGNVSFSQPNPTQPSMVRPSFLQASQMGAQPGGVNLASPALSKLGKLGLLLNTAASGALAGRAASEQMIAETGGKRAGGIGTGYQAGYQLPFLRALQQQKVQQAQADTAETQARTGQTQAQTKLLGESVPVTLPNGQQILIPSNQLGQYTRGLAGAQVGAAAKENVAQTGAKAKTDSAQIGANARVKAAQIGLGPYADVPQDLQDQFGLPAQLPLKMLNQAETAANRPLTVVQGESGPAVVNKAAAMKGKTGPTASLGLGAPALARPLQVADAANPGNTKVVSGGTAIRTGAAGSSSASVTAPKKVQEKYTSGNVSDQLLAIGTAREHMKLFGRLADALDTNDTQLLNTIGQQVGVQFGSDKKTNFDIAAQAFGGEVGKAFDGAGVVAGEREQAQKNFRSQMSKGQFRGAIQTVDSLLAGKQKSAKDAYEVTRKGQPNFGDQSGAQPGGGGVQVTDPRGVVHTFGDQASANTFKKLAGIK
jgi:hypothetical protein